MISDITGISPDKAIAFCCVHCITGREIDLAAAIGQMYPELRATAVMQTKRFTHKGVTSLHNEVILKGYVFIKATADAPIFSLLELEDAISILRYDGGEWRLWGDDAVYAEWIFRYNGIIRLSKAYQIGDRIHIVDGPLKDMEGQIIRIDRRNRSGQVALHVGGNLIKVWLGFELVNETYEDVAHNTAAAQCKPTLPRAAAGVKSCSTVP